MAGSGKFRTLRWLFDCLLVAAVAVWLYAVNYPKWALTVFAGFWFFNGALFGFWGGRRHMIRQLKENARRFEQELRS